MQHFFLFLFTVCRTVDGENCISGMYSVSFTVQRTRVHMQNCIPLSIDNNGMPHPRDNFVPNFPQFRRGLHDVNDPSSVQGVDYDWFCPISLGEPTKGDYHDGIYIIDPLHSQARFVTDYRTQMRRCANINLNSPCASTKTLEQLCSPKIPEGNKYM